MSSSINENQHYVPKFFLRNFVNKDGQLHSFNITTNEVIRIAPKNATSEQKFNEFVDGKKIFSFEDKFGKLEDKSSRIFRKIINKNSLASLTSNERRIISHFIATQSIRTDAFFKGLNNHIERKYFGKSFETLWESSLVTAKNINNRRWVLMKIEGDEVFYLGDHPVVLKNSENATPSQLLGFDIDGTDAFLPITPKLALWMPCQSITTEIINAFDDSKRTVELYKLQKTKGLLIFNQNISEINKMEEFINKYKCLYDGIKNGIPLLSTPENIKNLNALQIKFSYANIFSNQENFDFAKFVLSKTPEYGKTIKTSIVTKGIILVPIDS